MLENELFTHEEKHISDESRADLCAMPRELKRPVYTPCHSKEKANLPTSSYAAGSSSYNICWLAQKVIVAF